MSNATDNDHPQNIEENEENIEAPIPNLPARPANSTLHKTQHTLNLNPFPLPWEALITVIVVAILYTALSQKIIIVPAGVVLTVVLLLIAGLTFTRLRGHHILNHRLALATYAFITLAIVGSVTLLIFNLPEKSNSGVNLLQDGLLLWLSNVLVFALWYWQLDANGPYQRHHCQNYRQQAELLFPQLMPDCPGGSHPDQWKSQFIDYFFVAFNTSTAFSPTDTAILSRRLKLVSIMQASISLVIVAALVGRAVNII